MECPEEDNWSNPVGLFQKKKFNQLRSILLAILRSTIFNCTIACIPLGPEYSTEVQHRFTVQRNNSPLEITCFYLYNLFWNATCFKSTNSVFCLNSGHLILLLEEMNTDISSFQFQTKLQNWPEIWWAIQSVILSSTRFSLYKYLKEERTGCALIWSCTVKAYYCNT